MFRKQSWIYVIAAIAMLVMAIAPVAAQDAPQKT